MEGQSVKRGEGGEHPSLQRGQITGSRPRGKHTQQFKERRGESHTSYASVQRE